MTTNNSVPARGPMGSAEAAKAPKPRLRIDIEHQVPGRVRMKVKAAKGDAELLQQIGDTFGVIPGIQRVTVNPLTGSIVLHYDADDHHEFGQHFEKHLRSDRVAAPPPPATEIDLLTDKIASEAAYLAQHSHAAKAVVDFFGGLDNQIKEVSGNTVDLKIVFALAVIGVTVFEIGATAATPIWLTLAVFTVNHFIEMHHPVEGAVPMRAPVVVKAG